MVVTRRGSSTSAGDAAPASISGDVAQLSHDYWSPATHGHHKKFDDAVAASIYQNEIVKTGFQSKRLLFLEFSQYLECYLWPNFNEKSTNQHLISIVAMVNQKFRERVPAWNVFIHSPKHFAHFFERVLRLLLANEVSLQEEAILLAFLVNVFNSVEVDLVREHAMKLVHIRMWRNLLPEQLEEQLQANKKLRKAWTALQQKDEALGKAEKAHVGLESNFLWDLTAKFKKLLAQVDDENSDNTNFDVESAIHWLERFLELVVDLESLLSTRRFFNAILHASHILPVSTMSTLIQTEAGSLFCQLAQMLQFYARFEIDDMSGQALTQVEVVNRHYAHIAKLQEAAYRFFRESMRDYYLANVGAVDSRKSLTAHFQRVKHTELYRFAEFLRLVPKLPEKEGEDVEKLLARFPTQLLTEILVARCERRPNQLQQLNEQPLYPSERVIWDENLVPYENYSGEGVLALHKLNLQFLTLHDYLLRNLTLFQMESTYEIRQDLEDAIFRMQPWKHESKEKEIVYGGWARMALPLTEFNIVEVTKPLIGEKSPASVKGDFVVTLGRRSDIRQDWESLRKHDVIFLVTLRPKAPPGTKYNPRAAFKDQIQVASVRGCEVDGMIDAETGFVIEEFDAHEKRTRQKGDSRRFRVILDPNQYRLDMENHVDKGAEDVYQTFNLVVRRDPKTNNFKAVLATIRELLNTDCVVPDWLRDLILGYGDPNAAHYTRAPNVLETLDFNDTFLDWAHVKDAFPGKEVVAKAKEEEMRPPFRLTFRALAPQFDKKPEERDQRILVESLPEIRRSPNPAWRPNRNTVKFTPAQVEAIHAGMQPGLTMVVGPPGTGKTDVAVQIVANLYHNFPEQRTLLVTHSNQALNALFEKIIALDVDERHLLRMGHGEEALATSKDFSRYGRVNYVLARRLELLKEVERLQQAIGAEAVGGGAVAYTCENALHFFRSTICRLWDRFVERAEPTPDKNLVADHFPFAAFYPDLPNLFKRKSHGEDFATAEACWRDIQHIFEQLDEFRAFELMRTGRDRTEYLLVKEAKIIAMTCTHAALRRAELVKMGFRYDTILMEEAAQILEVETFIPLLLQTPKDGRNRLKRWIMIGDHHQLPPVVQNVAYQKYSNMEQSLFARFVRIGVPTVQLDQQGRARPEIASLYNWRYRSLGDLPHVFTQPEFQRANAGFAFPFQLVDVPDFNGHGESAPSPHFYQNLGEAEYAVALYTYMRVLGYPADKISILTTYNGQASLLNDVARARCAQNPLLGMPSKISTVDKYQGQQNDYVILSLVRTAHVGHLRDVRRLVVALSRARLGLIVLGRVEQFRACYELSHAVSLLLRNPSRLLLLPGEAYPTQRALNEKHPSAQPLEIVDTAHLCHFVHEFYVANLPRLKAKYEDETREERERQLEQQRLAEEARKAEEEAKAAEVARKAKRMETGDGTGEAERKNAAEKPIQFEEMDFEKLEEPPKL